MILKTAEIFGDAMVLQRNKSVRIWGNGRPGSVITLEIQGMAVQSEADANGFWELHLPPLKVSREEYMKISDGVETVFYKDVAVGEVWLAGGQSNMEFFMYYDKDYERMLDECTNNEIRFFDYPRYTTEEMREERSFTQFGYWRRCDADNLKYFSAVGYYFAKVLQKRLGVPVGVVGCNCGGTRACCWMDEETLMKCGSVWQADYLRGLAEIKDMEKAYKKYLSDLFSDKAHPFDDPLGVRIMRGLSEEEMNQMFSGIGKEQMGNVIGPWHEWRPNGLFHTMLERIIPYTICGVIWYQGESDEAHPELYADMMCGLIQCWRQRWGEELPFIMTQLAPFDGNPAMNGWQYPILREQQEAVTTRLRGVYCASIGDVGNRYDIHPKEKQPVGRRLALLALGHVYGQAILCDAPIPWHWERYGNQVFISFKNAGDGLSCKGDTVNGLELTELKTGISCEGNTAVSVEKARLVLTVPDACGKLRIAFAKTPYYEVNLYNSAEIPVKPFLIEI